MILPRAFSNRNRRFFGILAPPNRLPPGDIAADPRTLLFDFVPGNRIIR